MPSPNFRQIPKSDPIPYDLLLLADPSKSLIDQYLKTSSVYIAELNGQTVGVIVLYPLPDNSAEIKNIAVEPAWQGRGIGAFLIENIVEVASGRGYQSISIGTADSSVGPLHLYQKMGFEIKEIRTDFFIDHYPEPIIENGVRARDMVVLWRALSS